MRLCLFIFVFILQSRDGVVSIFGVSYTGRDFARDFENRTFCQKYEFIFTIFCITVFLSENGTRGRKIASVCGENGARIDLGVNGSTVKLL